MLVLQEHGGQRLPGMPRVRVLLWMCESSPGYSQIRMFGVRPGEADWGDVFEMRQFGGGYSVTSPSGDGKLVARVESRVGSENTQENDMKISLYVFMDKHCKHCNKSLKGLKVWWYCGSMRPLCSFLCALAVLRSGDYWRKA